MSSTESVRTLLASEKGRNTLTMLYGAENVSAMKIRFEALLQTFERDFPTDERARLFTAPGRTEIGGNHTDHQSGRVLAAAVHLDTVAVAAPNGSMLVHLHSEGFAPLTLDLSDLSVHEQEINTTAALIRGISARMRELGFAIGGFDACVSSAVPVGSGLSSSAAFEVLICSVVDGLFNRGDMDAVERAKVSKYAENVYFGKPSGLMDETASSVGGLVTIDFEKGAKVEALSYDFAAKGYSLCVTSTGGSHGDLTSAYAAIPADMKLVSNFFGAELLRFVDEKKFYEALPELRKQVPDRAILRAMHFFGDNARVPRQVEALRKDDLNTFYKEVIASGESSWKYLQNVWATQEDQSLALALALSEKLLSGRGAWRIHGGGFAGTIQAFVPQDLLEEYKQLMDGCFGKGACTALRIRPVGAYEIV